MKTTTTETSIPEEKTTSARLKHFFLTIRSFLSINYYRLSQQTVQSITSDRTVHYNGLYDSL